MNKKILSALLMGAFFLASTSMFVSCKDYDDDIKNLQAQIDKNTAAINAIQTKINEGGILESVTKTDNGIRIVINGQSYDITNGQDGAPGAPGTPGTVWTIGTDGYWYKDGVKQDYKAIGQDGATPTVEIKDGYWYINNKNTGVKATGNDGVTPTVEIKGGYWYINGVNTGVKAEGQPGTTTTVVTGVKYYVPNPETGTFWIYNDGDKDPYDSGIKYVSEGEGPISGITAVKTNEYLYLYGVEGGEGALKLVTISLSADLKGLVFVPHLYLDGIESIEYPWIGDTILRKFPLPGFWKNLSHHTSETGDRQDIDDIDFDYLPNFLGRQLYYDGTNAGNKILTNRYVRKAADADPDHRIYWREPSWPADEWIYGPAWEVWYHLNPSSAKVTEEMYDTYAPSFNVLEPDVVYYNTRAAASALGVTSPKNFYELYDFTKKTGNNFARGAWRTGVAVPNTKTFRKDGTGIVYVGLQIAHPDRLAPWPTDETINPNGNTDSKVSYPANQQGGNQPFAGNKTTESYPVYGSWYGWTRYGVINGSTKAVDKNNSDNTIALQMHTGTDEQVTSDYALIVPTHVQLEGLIWDKKPMYVEPKINQFAGGPGTRMGDEEGWAIDENQNCTTVDDPKSRIHVWDSPEEALADPDGAALEIYAQDAAGLDLKPYLGVHYVRENLKKRETAPGVYNAKAYDILTLHNGEEAAWGLHYEYEFVDYLNSSNNTHDSRYATFSEWEAGIAKDAVITGWNKTTSTSGVVKVKSVDSKGQTINTSSTTAVDREPLVRVMLKNEAGDVLLDGYILLHINYTPENINVLTYEIHEHTFNLCDPASYYTTWSQFSKWILQDALAGRFKVDAAVDNTGMEILSFDDYYWAICKENPAGTAVPTDDQKYVTPQAFPVSVPNPYNPLDAHLQGYQLKLYNFGANIFGMGDGGNGVDPTGAGLPPVRGFATEETSTVFENKELGNAIYFPNGEGTTNHTFSWTLSEEEIEYLTHDNPDALDKDKGVKVVRWIAFVAKDLVRGREVNNYSAPYPYIWVKLTYNLKRDAIAYKYTEKINNYWFNYQNGDGAGWSGILFDIQAPGNYSKPRTKDQRWISYISQTMTADGTDNHYKLVKVSGATSNKECGHSKYYFAPKEYDITCKTMINGYADASIKDINGKKPNEDLTTYTITPKNTSNLRYSEPTRGRKFNIPAPVSPFGGDVYENGAEWNQLFCKYVYPHTYDNLYMDKSEWWTHNKHNNGPVDFRHVGTDAAKADNDAADIRYINEPTFHNYIKFLPNVSKVKASADKHEWKESTLKKTLQECAIRYNDGAFNDTILYAYNHKTKEYTAIARINTYEQYNVGALNDSWREAGSIELIHWLPLGATAQDVKDGKAIENLVLYDVLNALGYPMKRNADGTVAGCDFDNAREFINKQFRAWVGVVANNGCDVALYVAQGNGDEKGTAAASGIRDDFSQALDDAIEVNGPLKNGRVVENTVNATGLTMYIAAPAETHKYDPVATLLTSWQRPINLDQTPIDAALDAKTGENVIYLLDYLKLFDWRGDKPKKDGYMYDNHFWFWAYYNVKGIMVDMQTDKIWTNMHQDNVNTFVPLNKISTRAHIWAGKPYYDNRQAYYGEGWDQFGNRVTGESPDFDDWQLDTKGFYAGQTQEPAIEQWMGVSPRNETRLARFGSIFYENNGDNVEVFDVIIPITIFYEWGSQKYYTKWHIDTTHGRSND